MKSKWRSRTVYVATIAAMSMMVAGFALASGLFAGFGAITVQGNQGAIATANTIYQPGLSGSVYMTGTDGTGGTCTANTNGGSASNVVVTAWVSGGPGACSGVSDFVLQLTFSSADTLTAGTYTDVFVISSEFGSATSMTTSTVSIGCGPTSAPAMCSAVINIDTGVPATSAQPGVTAIDVTVTGS
ncbi:MAG TPA: hypothetical protein VMG14_04655 [Thermoplasmata archaeon]|nr:hypothetical protein [Thermoplasmata archaeon]